MKAHGGRRRDTTELVGAARGQVRRFCWLRHDEVPRLDQLAGNLRSHTGARVGRIHRPDLLSTLLLSGLELAEPRGQVLVIFPGFGVRFEYALKLEEAGRLDRFRRLYWPSSTKRPATGFVHGALMRLALQTAETSEHFARELASRMLRPSEST